MPFREEKRVSVMRTYSQHRIWITAFLLLMITAGCSDPDKNAGSIQNTVP